MAAHGLQRVEDLWKGMNKESATSDPNSGDFMRQHSQNKLGQAVYSLIPENIKTRFMPHNHFIIRPEGKVFHLDCKSIFSHPTSRGNIHFGVSTPFLGVGTGKRMLAFTTHALQRVCERIAPKWKTHL